jgi:predicted metal-dependent phosphoesterase TrpH
MVARVSYGTPDLNALRKSHALFDMHLHTRYSRDCNTPISSLLRRAEQLGIGVAITDHNEARGALLACKQRRVPIIPGIEITSREKKDILVYFYTPRELRRFYEGFVRPNQRPGQLRFNTLRRSMEEILIALTSHNAVVAIAHPFGPPPKKSHHFFTRQKRSHLLQHVHAVEVFNKQSHLLQHVHAVEVFNKQSHSPVANYASHGWAASLGKPMIGGSDGHTLIVLGHGITYAKANTRQQFLDAIKQGKCSVVGQPRSTGAKFVSIGKVGINNMRFLKAIKNGKESRR